MDDKRLPDLPGSSDEDLKKNEYHSFFKKTPRDVWLEAEIGHTEIPEHKQCDHYFQYVKGGVECKGCHMGLMGHLDIKKGKLFYQGQELFKRG